MNGRTQPYFFSFETETKPGKIVAHCVRIETIEIAGDRFDQTRFTLFGADAENDLRLRQLISCAATFHAKNPDLFPKDQGLGSE